ncbi:MAG: cytochrome c3 family protein [Ignavibacteriales bacterium]|nr:cytochrome c3 family protein [Ignavibacteriales bacterium]
MKYVAKAAEVPWERVYKVPDHVYFSHRRHVVAGRLECEVCHGNVQQFTMPVSLPEIPVTMENCMSCHRKHNVTNDCLSCHR